MKKRIYAKNEAIQAPTKMRDVKIVVVWSVFAGPRRSTGAWSVLVAATLRPPSRTWRSMSTMSTTAEMSMTRFIGKIKDPESVAKSPFFAIIFLQSGPLYGNMSLWNKFCSSFSDTWALFLPRHSQGILVRRVIHLTWIVYFLHHSVFPETGGLIMLLNI